MQGNFEQRDHRRQNTRKTTFSTFTTKQRSDKSGSFFPPRFVRRQCHRPGRIGKHTDHRNESRTKEKRVDSPDWPRSRRGSTKRWSHRLRRCRASGAGRGRRRRRRGGEKAASPAIRRPRIGTSWPYRERERERESYMEVLVRRDIERRSSSRRTPRASTAGDHRAGPVVLIPSANRPVRRRSDFLPNQAIVSGSPRFFINFEIWEVNDIHYLFLFYFFYYSSKQI